MIAASMRWFNPLMYFIKMEISHACELACDEIEQISVYKDNQLVEFESVEPSFMNGFHVLTER